MDAGIRAGVQFQQTNSPPVGGEFILGVPSQELEASAAAGEIANMSTSHKKYAVSTNADIIDKPEKSALGASVKNWQRQELTEQGLTAAIQRGVAIAPQYRDGRRNTKNFECAGFLAADVDRDLSLDDARDHALVKHHAALIHTTASHTPERHRFRIIYLLDEPVLLARDWADAELGLALAVGSDQAVADGARMFFGNTRATIFRISRTMPAKIVADLIARGRDARRSRSPIDGRALPVDSARRIAGAELVRCAGGQEVRMDEIGVGVSVHCPHHEDADPSAFTVRSQRGHIGIHCMACKATFWPVGGGDGYDFGAFDKLCEEVRLGQQAAEPDVLGLDRFFPPDPKLERLQEQYLPPIAYAPGITLIKSPKGSGKTEALKSLLSNIRAGLYRGDVERKDRVKSVLLVCHRTSLTREVAAKLGLRCYLDEEESGNSDLLTLADYIDSLPKHNEGRAEPFDLVISGKKESGNSNLLTLAVCLDSLPKFNEGRKAFDLVILDESEQVLSHLQGKTIEKRFGIERCFDALKHEISNAKAVIALDADLGLVTAQAMRTMRPQDWHSRCRIILNAPVVPVQKRVMRLHKNRQFLAAEMIEAIKRGERCFVVSNSKKFIKVAHRMILNACGDGVTIRVITSETSRDDATIEFIKNIKTAILTVQVVLASPSIGTGVDITFPGGACLVDRVFGFFYPFVNTHTDIDQQLCRVRNPGAVDVWIDAMRFEFTSNVDVIKDDLARAYTVRRAVKGRREDGMVEYERDEPLLMLCAHVTALQRASKNRLVDLFCQLREANGWQIERVGEVSASKAYDDAKKMLVSERIEQLMQAKTVSSDDYIELDSKATKGASMTPEEQITYEKNYFERTVGVALDRELIEMNLDGKLIQRIETMARVVKCWAHGSEAIDARLQPATTPQGRLREAEPPVLVALFLRFVGLTTADGFDLGRALSISDLVPFAALCRTNQTMIEEAFAEAMRADLAENPMRQLNQFLRRIGMKLKPAKTTKVRGEKIRFYALPADNVDLMLGLARSYQAVCRRQEIEAEERGMIGGRARSPNRDSK